MATGKRYYWIKLKDSFMNSEVVDFLMSQPNGANYVVLYQMLCLKTINTGGRLTCQIGDIIIPFDMGKIQRDCKWFSLDTISETVLLHMMADTTYMTGKEAVEKGFADELLDDAEPVAISASADRQTIYANGHALRLMPGVKLPDNIPMTRNRSPSMPEK